MHSQPSTSKMATIPPPIVEKPEEFEIHEHVGYKEKQTIRTPPPAAYDVESDDLYDSSWETAWRALCLLYNTINHMIIALIVFTVWKFAMTVEANGEVNKLQLHIAFGVTGYQLFLAEAILTLHPHNAWSTILSRDAKRVVHGCLQIMGGIFVVAGSGMIIAYKSGNHFESAHGICGVIALIFTVISLVNGIFTLFSAKVRLMIKSGPFKIFHVVSALHGMVMGLVTMVIGFNKDYFRHSNANQGSSIALMFFTVMVMLYIVVIPIKNLVKQIRTML